MTKQKIMTQLIPLFLFQLLKGKFYRCFNHNKTNSILGLDELRCCELVLRSTEVQQVHLDTFPHKMRWSCLNCLCVNQADSVTCKSVLCPKEAAVSNIEVGSKSKTIRARATFWFVTLSIYCVSDDISLAHDMDVIILIRIWKNRLMLQILTQITMAFRQTISNHLSPSPPLPFHLLLR